MIKIYYIAPDGAEYESLPCTWHNATNITERWALAHGWVKNEEEVPDPEIVWHYSKYRLYLALERENLWDAFWNALDESQKRMWDNCQELQSDDPFFAAALAGIKERLQLDETLIEQILEESQL